MIPFDAEFAAAHRGRVHLRGARRRARRRAGRDRRELPLRAQGAGRPAAARRRRALSDGRAPAAGGGRGDRLLQPHPRSGARRRGGPGRAAFSAPRFSCAARSSTATSAGASWAFRPPTSCPRRRSCAPATGCMRAWPNGSSGCRQHRRAPDVRDRPRRADRGVPDRLRRRPVRQHAAPGLPRAPARRAAVRHARGADRADAQRRGAHARDRRGG